MTTLFGNTAVPTQIEPTQIQCNQVQPSQVQLGQVQPTDSAAPRKRGWLPLLTVLFLISYGLMTMLIVEQGATIESQRALIRELFRDSTELNAAKMRAQQERAMAARGQSSVNQSPVTQFPSSQNPSTQAPARTPSSQAGSQHRTQNQSANQKPQFQMPSRPASDVSDGRRALRTI